MMCHFSNDRYGALHKTRATSNPHVYTTYVYLGAYIKFSFGHSDAGAMWLQRKDRQGK